MMMRPAESIWVVMAVAQPGEECENPPEALGASLQAFVPAAHIDEALTLSRQAFADHHFIDVEVDQILRFEVDDWDEESDPDSELRSMAKRAEEAQEIVCSVEWWDGSDMAS